MTGCRIIRFPIERRHSSPGAVRAEWGPVLSKGARLGLRESVRELRRARLQVASALERYERTRAADEAPRKVVGAYSLARARSELYEAWYRRQLARELVGGFYAVARRWPRFR